MQSLENAYYKELFANQFYKVSLYTNTIYSSVIWTCKNCPIDFKLIFKDVFPKNWRLNF